MNFFDRFCNLMLEADEKLSPEEYDILERDVLVEVQKSIQWREKRKKNTP